MVTPAFVTAAALLTLATLAWVLRPLWRQHRTAMAVAMAGLALATGLLYGLVGTPAALDPAQRQMPATMQEAITRLEAELQRDPNQVDGLRLLARAYLQQQQPVKARDAYTRAVRLAPEDPDLLAESAEARALADPQRRFDADAIAQLQAALKLQPMHQRARWFLGVAQRQRGEHAAAASTWEPLLAVVDASTAAALRPQLDAARSDAGLPPLPARQTAPAATAAAGPGLRVNVAIDPQLAQKLPGASVFVIARIPGGPPMPVAVEKHPANALPATITLDDADSPMPTQKLSALQDIEVFARLSQSGNAMRQDGDVDSKPVRVALPARAPVELRLP
jgi:cytochrome c-type biogenesis protein CcmH